MAYKNFDDLSLSPTSGAANETLQINGPSVDLPDASYVKDAALERDGADLVLDGPQGTLTIEGYFSAAETPDLVAPNGETLTPELVNSFARSPAQYAQSHSMNDESPVGSVDEISGEATITHLDGSVEHITQGMPIYQGDVIETAADGAVNIAFIDETSFAVSEDARLAIDEYVYDPSTESGSQDFSVLKGMFVFTSGLIGRDDPDDVNIDTPSGSIGIRGTIIAGNVDTGEITVVEGAIVVRDLSGHEMTLATQFETAKLDPTGGEIQNMGQLPAHEVSQRFSGVVGVSPTLFSSINDAAAEQGTQPVNGPQEQPRENFDAEGTLDHNNDGEVDGSVEGGDDAAGNGDGAPLDGAKDPALMDGEPVKLTGEDGLAPKPMMNPMQTGMMGTDPMGMHPMGMNQAGTMNTTAGMETLDGGKNTMDGMDLLEGMNPDGRHAGDDNMPPPPPTGENLQDPNTIIPPNSDTTPPLHVSDLNSFAQTQISTAPNEFFATSDNMIWDYHFDKEFIDPDGGDLHFELSAGTKDILNTTSGITTWTFDNANGHLTINTASLPGDFNFNIQVRAIDQAGNAGSFENYTFHLEQKTGTFPSTVDSTGTDVLTGSANADTTTLGGSSTTTNKTIFAGDGDDNILIYDYGYNNTIHLGNGENIFVVTDGATGNTAIGGFEKDTFNMGGVQNHAIGMDGDDIFKINFSTGPAKTELETSGNSNILMDGGHSSYRMPFLLHGQTPPASELGRGDTLSLEGTGVELDFTAVDNNYFRGIERIDLLNGSTTGAGITLGLNDVINMTDHNNILLIRADSNDCLTFVPGDFANFTKTENKYLDDNLTYTATTGDDTNFTMYSNGNVTLLIEDNGATVSGLPA